MDAGPELGGDHAHPEADRPEQAGTALVGCDGIEEVEYLERPFSTIALPIAEMCATAHEFLRRRKEEPDAPLQSAVLPARFVSRP